MKKLFIYFTILLIFESGFSQNSFTDLVKKTEKSVVTVNTFTTNGNPLKVGTAFFIDESGILLSNYHVFSEAYSVLIKTSGGKEYHVNRTISFDSELDLIKFSISNPDNEYFPKLEMALSQPVKGEDVFVIGTPGGFESSVSKGIVSGIRDIPDAGRLFQITAPISPGSSGSPVLNMQGKVFGIASLQYQEGQNLNFAIDINLVNKLSEGSENLKNETNNKTLLNDKSEARKAITLNSAPSVQTFEAINEYIAKFPNDYYGYLQRALAFNDRMQTIEGVTRGNFNQKFICCLIESDKDFVKALQLSSNKSIIYFYRGVTKYNHLDYTDPKLIGWNLNGALSDLNKCVGFDGGDHIYNSKFEYIGDIKRALNDYIGAIAAYKQAIISFPDRNKIYQVYNKCADIYYYDLKDKKNASSFNKIAFSYLDISKINDDSMFTSWDMFILRANIRSDLNDLSGALADVNFVLQCECMEAINAYNHFLKASLIMSMDGDRYEVISSLSKAIEYTENEDGKALLYDLRSTEYYMTKQFQLALIDRNRYFELTPISDLTAYNYSSRSNIKESLSDFTGALKDINKAIELDWTVADYYNSKGDILSNMYDKIGAIKAYDKAIQLNPKEVHYYIMRGFAKYDSNKTDACADWSKAGEMGDYSAYDLISKYCH